MPVSRRYIWGQEPAHLPPLNLTQIQLDSWQWFISDGIKEAVAEISPVEDFTGKNWLLEFGAYSVEKPKITPQHAIRKGLTHSSALRVAAKLTNKQTRKTTASEVFLGDIPQMTSRGTFIVNGVERVVVNQIVRSPGVYFGAELDAASGKLLHTAELRPIRGTWLEFETARSDVIYIRIDRRRKFLATTILRAMGLSEFPEGLEAAAAKDTTKTTEDALIEVYKKMRPGEPIVLENAQKLLYDLFFNPRRYDLGAVGRYKINRRLGGISDSRILTRDDLVAAIKYLISLSQGQGYTDDIDNLANRRVRRVGEIVVQTAFREGLLRLERAIREKMSLVYTEELITPTQLVNARPVISAINQFFRSSQLSQILDQTNPLSEIDHLRRLSVFGPGGLTRERASFSIRDINASQYSRIDPVRSPEGPNIGLITYLSLYARINEYGFLEAPYRRVIKRRVTDEIVYLTADDEEQYRISSSDMRVDSKGYILDKWLPIRHANIFTEGPASQVDFVDVVARQVVGTSASLIPFLANDAANRALMGTNMQSQAVPLLSPSAPIVGTGMEKEVAAAMGWAIYATYSGTVAYVDANKIIIKLDKKPQNPAGCEEVVFQENLQTFYLTKFKRTSHSTNFSQTPVVSPGQKVTPGTLLADGPATENGEIALGQNLLIAYASYDGLGYEDAIVISDRLVTQDLLTSIHIEKYEADVVDTKLGPEEPTRDIPNVGESYLANLDEGGFVTVGSEVRPNDILVGKIAPKGETELSAEERLLRAIFGEKARDVRDTSLRMPHGERGIVVDVHILDREAGDELPPGTSKRVVVKVAQLRKITVGDKLAGRHGNKGVISKIVPVADMPHLADGTPVDIMISPLSVLARMNLGQLLEARLGWAMRKLGQTVAVPVFERVSEDQIAHSLIKAGLPVSGKAPLIDGRTGLAYEQTSVVGIGYILKLHHMVEDKTHARSTGPYSLITQQPLGGKAQMGGQRLGEMEVWGLEAHKAAATLQEMLTIKSDDVVGRAKAFEAIVKGTEIPSASVPESFNVLVKELQSLGLQVIPQGVQLKANDN
ncbi:MAG: DNA-directed RNA polymerase subunit beta [Candidatus Amesbacteria bacterium GW2011_GWB1_47_26]|uniref:DNA-directed RNA polymerase subunit beta n=1 Tax=Candidatus Amesbacteria bacterium GW2011_GWC2_45_19 TaxID=1618366 RepID=A0A0G1PCB2_9BACT|nr:MAG: DNA-directed RNA polymerase subunit beta [Candidatus Amesbacteria bacterium GW2011_GWC2_45_19]KKU38503.1 MAG: DNA-directed RNA polymerase subunit beta [Candidatus Amesbacteria bacterium GW2011_GWA1_46_35]KKU69208.1 MAG: DNA-directed RNA polymerase subunit beta [Microgenomates group bacterium GW2011_GWC1_47_20]KKU74671.1 MAG: DNA-directed RNA polymerase subunit beta [Candidatus Amesbacteria bacterium GW2011_GWB1_47_26]KKU80141.1 MAG: DNA-directed RNA polymerase subunit beta [Candidatus A